MANKKISELVERTVLETTDVIPVVASGATETNKTLLSTLLAWIQINLIGKFNTPTGDTTQYIAGDGTLITFPVAGQSGALVREVRNNTGETLNKGTVVYINGANGNKPTIAKAQANSESTSARTFGLLQSNIDNNSNGYVVVIGDLTGLDTSSFTEGVQLYLSGTVAGEYTSTKTLAPTHLVYIGKITRSHPTLGQIEVGVQNGYEIDEIHDVSIVSKANNEGIFYDSTTSLWKNKTIASVLGFTPVTQGRTITINSVTYDLSANRSWSITSVAYATAAGYADTCQDAVYASDAGYADNANDCALWQGLDAYYINNVTPYSSNIDSIVGWNFATNSLTKFDSAAVKLFLGLGSAAYLASSYFQTALGFTPVTNARTISTTSPLLGGGDLTANRTFSIQQATSLQAGYLSSTDWTTFNNKQNLITNNVTGTGFLSSLAYWTSSSQIGYLNTTTYPSLVEIAYVKGVTSSIQTQLNGKQATLTNPIIGTGTTGYIPKFTGTTSQGNSPIYANGTNVSIGSTSLPYPFYVATQVDNISIYAVYDIVAFSDESVKENIRPIENVLDRILKSRGILYDRIDNGSKDNIGFIAQELEMQFPELVVENEDGTKAVKYQNAVAVLFEAIKEQQKQIEDLKELVNKLIAK